MFSPFRRHQKQVRAALAAGEAGTGIAGVAAPMPETGETASEYRALRAALHEDLRRLSEVQSVTARNPIKADLAGQYDAWVDGALAAGRDGKAAQDEIVVTMMIWAIDCRAIDRALDIAEHVLAHGLSLPERYNRTAACLVAEEIAEAALKEPGTITLAQLRRVAALTVERDMPDQARAKLFKALGRAGLAAAEAYDPQADNGVAGGKAALLESALADLGEAKRLNKAIGVVHDIRAAESGLKKLAPPPA